MADTVHERPSKLQVTIEVCVDSVESAVAAVRGGANRLELCSNLGYGGGTTPSIGLLRSVKKAVPNVPIMVMVRPRAGDFVYSEVELDVMLQDISAFKEHGVQGVVFGALTASGDVDESKVKGLVEAAVPLEGESLYYVRHHPGDPQNAVCFHRAFDMASNVKNAWQALSKITGITRILTSGQRRRASSPEALETLAWLFDSASGTSITILPGSGITISTIPMACKALVPHGLREIHMSGGKWIDGQSAYRPDEMGMGEWNIWRTDEAAVREVRDFVDSFFAMETSNSPPP